MMPGLALWQRILHIAGQLVIYAGAGWALYLRFVVRVCPAGVTGWFTPYGLMFTGVALAVLPLAPFPGAPWLRSFLRRQPVVALVWYAIAVAGCIWASLGFTAGPSPMQWSMLGLVPPITWWFLATEAPPPQKKVKPQKEKPAEGGGADA